MEENIGEKLGRHKSWLSKKGKKAEKKEKICHEMPINICLASKSKEYLEEVANALQKLFDPLKVTLTSKLISSTRGEQFDEFKNASLIVLIAVWAERTLFFSDKESSQLGDIYNHQNFKKDAFLLILAGRFKDSNRKDFKELLENQPIIKCLFDNGRLLDKRGATVHFDDSEVELIQRWIRSSCEQGSSQKNIYLGMRPEATLQEGHQQPRGSGGTSPAELKEYYSDVPTHYRTQQITKAVPESRRVEDLTNAVASKLIHKTCVFREDTVLEGKCIQDLRPEHQANKTKKCLEGWQRLLSEQKERIVKEGDWTDELLYRLEGNVLSTQEVTRLLEQKMEQRGYKITALLQKGSKHQFDGFAHIFREFNWGLGNFMLCTIYTNEYLDSNLKADIDRIVDQRLRQHRDGDRLKKELKESLYIYCQTRMALLSNQIEDIKENVVVTSSYLNEVCSSIESKPNAAPSHDSVLEWTKTVTQRLSEAISMLSRDKKVVSTTIDMINMEQQEIAQTLKDIKAEQQKQISTLKEEIKFINIKLEDAKEQGILKAVEIEELQNKISELKVVIEEKEMETLNFETKETAQNKELEMMKTHEGQLNQIINELEKKIDEKDSYIDVKDSYIDKLERKIARLQSKLDKCMEWVDDKDEKWEQMIQTQREEKKKMRDELDKTDKPEKVNLARESNKEPQQFIYRTPRKKTLNFMDILPPE